MSGKGLGGYIRGWNPDRFPLPSHGQSLGKELCAIGCLQGDLGGNPTLKSYFIREGTSSQHRFCSGRVLALESERSRFGFWLSLF